MELTIRIDGVDKTVQAEILKNTLWIHYEGQTFTLEAASGRRSKKKSATGSSDQIVAPMPGKVTKLLLSAGDSVEKGQAVLVMEAMKMEYTLKSEIAGTLLEINCSVGDQVVLGKVLAKIQPQTKG